MTFETERLCLRPWRETDAEACFRYAADPEVGPMAGWLPHVSVADSRRVIRDVLSAEGTFALCVKENGDTPVGSVGYFRPEYLEDYEIGYWVARPFWGNGYAGEAVECLLRCLFSRPGINRIWCGHFTGNDRSRRVIEKCGFRSEFLREHMQPALGERRVEHFYSLRREEFFNKYGETP